MNATLECPLCGGVASLRAAALPGYVRSTTFPIYRCSRCDAAFVSPRVSSDALYDTIYSQADRIPGYSRYGEYARLAKVSPDPLSDLSAAEDVYWAVANALETRGLRQSGRRILEVGSGLGYFTYALARRGYDIRAIDISETAVESARRRFGELFTRADLADYALAHPDSFDAVIACEVIEHLADPVAFVKLAFALVKPGGHLILTTPNRSFFGSDVLWETDLPPVHFWWYSEQSIEALMRQIGGRIEFVDFTPYQKRVPLYMPADPPIDVPTRSPILDQRGRVLRPPSVLSRAKRRVGALLPALKAHPVAQRLLGRRRVEGPRRTVMCAIVQRPV
jgi:SAM-dependent methyltransferase